MMDPLWLKPITTADRLKRVGSNVYHQFIGVALHTGLPLGHWCQDDSVLELEVSHRQWLRKLRVVMMISPAHLQVWKAGLIFIATAWELQ